MKGYKVTNALRSKTVGIGCDSLLQLRAKGIQKLEMEEPIRICLQDGTVVDSEKYFQTLPQQTLLVFYREHEDIKTGVDIILNVLHTVNANFLETGSKVNEIFLKDIGKKMSELSALIQKYNKKQIRENYICKNTRSLDPNWFIGLETNAKTKEEFMFKKCQDRIRGYYYKAQDDIRKHRDYLENKNNCRIHLDNCLHYFKEQLQKDCYFGFYFDRRFAKTLNFRDGHILQNLDSLDSCKRKKGNEIKNGTNETEHKISYCDNTGLFSCQGEWNAVACQFSIEHLINPYISRESRILFSTWNLDHRIEKSRSVIPCLIETCCDVKDYQSVNYLYFYKLLFTNYNLKLVHIVCHDKVKHTLQCDRNLVFKSVHDSSNFIKVNTSMNSENQGKDDQKIKHEYKSSRTIEIR